MRVSTGDYGVGRRELLEAVEAGRVARNFSPVAWAESGLASVALVFGDMAGAAVHAAVAESLMTAQGDQFGPSTVLANRIQVARASVISRPPAGSRSAIASS